MRPTQPDRTDQITKWLLSFRLVKTEQEEVPLVCFLCSVVEEMTPETRIWRDYAL